MTLPESFEELDLPAREDDRYEFKGSEIVRTGKRWWEGLQPEIEKAASGFWNKGGGMLIVGVGGNGKPDGGIPASIGNKPIGDWVDKVIRGVAETDRFLHKPYPANPNPAPNGQAAKCILAIEFLENPLIPFMAPDNKYYVRVGVHTVPASQYLVEALWARRHATRPRLAHLFRLSPGRTDVYQLGIVALTDQPALDVQITFDPVPNVLKESQCEFPIMVPVIDKANPYFMHLAPVGDHPRHVGRGVKCIAKYDDLTGKSYQYETSLDGGERFAGIVFTNTPLERLAVAAESIAKRLGSSKG